MQVYEWAFQILQVALWSSDEPNCMVIGGILCEIYYDLRWSIYIENVDNESEGKADSLTLPVFVQKNYKMWRKKILEIFEIKITYLNVVSSSEGEGFSIFKHVLLLVKWNK
jgi:hypothetical protein